MTKHSRWMMLLCGLICLCMLFASCSPDRSDSDAPEQTDAPVLGETEETPKDEDGEETEEEYIPDNQTVIYRAIAEEWSKYLTYKEPEIKTPLTATALIELPEQARVYTEGVFVYAVETNEEEGYQTYRYSIYNARSGKAVIPPCEYTGEPNATQYFFQTYDAVLEILTETLMPTGQYVYAYDYYTADGVKLNEEPLDVFSRGTQTLRNGYAYFAAGDVCCISKDGTVLRILPKGSEHDLPAVDRTYGAYSYSLGEENVYILDQNYEVLISYPLSQSFPRDQIEFTVLSNGNLLISYQRECADGEERYTVKDAYGNKYLLSYVVLDVKSGAATEIPVQFFIQRLVTNAEDDGMGLSVKDDRQYAEIVRIENKELVGTTVPVILDEALGIKAELPLILKNQESLVRAVSDRFWVFSLRAVNSRLPYLPVTYYYSLDLSVGTVALYADLDHVDYQRVDGGFVFEDALYNDMMIKQTDLSDADRYSVLDNGRVMVEATSESEGFATTLLYMENHQLKTAALGGQRDTVSVLASMGSAFRVDRYDTDGLHEWTELRNENGDLLCSGKTVSVSHVDEGLYLICCESDGRTVYYTVQ